MPEEAPFQVMDPIDMGDLSGQESGDVIDPAQGVQFEVTELRVKKNLDKDTKEFKFAQLDPTFTVGPQGVDGDGKYANRKFFGWKNLRFPGLMLAFNKELYVDNNTRQASVDWWTKTSRFQTKQFFQALGYDPAQLPQVTDDLLKELKGKQVIANITKEQVEELVDGKRTKTGDFINYLKDFRSV